jgi:hypothetical protein
MSDIKVKLKNFWESLNLFEQYNLIEDIITSEIKRGGLFFKSTLIVDRKNFGKINLTITDKKDILNLVSEPGTFPKDLEEILEMSIRIIRDMINREIKDKVLDIEMTDLKSSEDDGHEDHGRHDFRELEDALSSLSMSNSGSEADIEMKGIHHGRHDYNTLTSAMSNIGGKTRKKRKRRTKKHLRKKYSAKRMSRKK